MGVVRTFAASHRWTSGFVAGLASAALVATGVAVAANSASGSGSITACVAKSSGAVRIIGAGRHCKATEHRIAWSTGYRYKGAWSASKAYAELDIVTAQGSSYVAKAASHGKTPASSPTVWGLLAAAGGKGNDGDQGVPGPGAVTATAYATTGTNFEDVEIPGTGLTMRAVCGPSNTSAVYLTDDDGSAAYDVAGTYNLTTTGSTHATVLYTGHLSDPNLAQGLGLVHLTQAADMGVASEFILSWGSGSGGTMRLDVSVARGSHHALVHAGMYLSASECLVQVDATPAT